MEHESNQPINYSPHIRSIVLDLLLTVLFCGLWNIVVQYKQIHTLNYLLKEERYQLWKISVLIRNETNPKPLIKAR